MKKAALLLLLCCTCAASGQNLSDSLQACYPLDQNAHNQAPTGAALNGTLTNVFSTTGHSNLPGTAYRLLGNVGSFIELHDHPGVKSDPVFFSGWFRIDSLPNIQYLVYTTNGCLQNFEAYSLHLYYDGSLSQYVFCVTKCTDCNTKPQIVSTTAPVVGNWYHVCFFISDSEMKLYVNGSLESFLHHNVQTFGYQPGFSVYLGVTNQSHFNHPFKGAIDDVRFYNRDLTQQEVTLLYTQDPLCLPPVSAFLVAEPEICSGASVTFSDQSTNSPTSWSWQFPGANPASSTLSIPSVVFPAAGVYTVSLVASSAAGPGNVSVQTVTVGDCTSIHQPDGSGPGVAIYPNPASGRLRIVNLGDRTMRIYDALGKPVKYIECGQSDQTIELPLNNFSAGIYFAKISDRRGVHVRTVRLVISD